MHAVQLNTSLKAALKALAAGELTVGEVQELQSFQNMLQETDVLKKVANGKSTILQHEKKITHNSHT